MSDIKQNISLASLTTFGIGGKARFFVEVASADELAEAVKFTGNNKLAVFVLGGGSNALVSDDGFDGLVIKMNICGITPTNTSTGLIVRAGAGETWDNVVAKSIELNAGGLENLSLIPGTVGGAVCQNIGAYGVELKDVLVSVKTYDISNGNVGRLSNKECGFKYRSSVFKKDENLIILEAELFLSENNKPDLSYPDLSAVFKNRRPNIGEVRSAIIEIRKNKLPYPDEIGNAGSFFKNPIITSEQFKELKNKYTDLRSSPVRGKTPRLESGSSADHAFQSGRTSNGIKLSAAQLIEKTGWKGKRYGSVGVSDKHSLVLVNYGKGTAKEMCNLESEIRESVEAKFGVKLSLEVEKVGGLQ